MKTKKTSPKFQWVFDPNEDGDPIKKKSSSQISGVTSMVSHHKMVSPQMVSPQDGSTRGGPPPPQATPLRGNSTENRNSNTICTFKNGWWEFANKAPLATPLLFFFLNAEVMQYEMLQSLQILLPLLFRLIKTFKFDGELADWAAVSAFAIVDSASMNCFC